MILNKMSESLRRHDWLAVVVEIGIVIAAFSRSIENIEGIIASLNNPTDCRIGGGIFPNERVHPRS